MEYSELNIRLTALEANVRRLFDRVADVEGRKPPLKSYSRDGVVWTQFEHNMLNDRLDQMVSDMSIEFSRTQNAIWWAIYKYAGEKKYYAGEKKY